MTPDVPITDVPHSPEDSTSTSKTKKRKGDKDGDVIMTDEKIEEWRAAFNKLISSKLSEMEGSNSPVLQEKHYNSIVKYLKDGIDDENELDKLDSATKTRHWRWKNDYALHNETILKYSDAEKGSNTPELPEELYNNIVKYLDDGIDDETLDNATKTIHLGWKNDYVLHKETIIKYSDTEKGIDVSHTGRMFSDLVGVYCPEKKHAHNIDPNEKKKTVKERYGRSITKQCIEMFNSSCPMCCNLKQAKVEKVRERVREEVDELREKLQKKNSEIKNLQEGKNWEIQNLQAKIDETNKQLAEKESKIATLQAQITTFSEPTDTSTFPDVVDTGMFFDDEGHDSSSDDANRSSEGITVGNGNNQFCTYNDVNADMNHALLLYSRISEYDVANLLGQTKTSKTPIINDINHFWASLRSILYTVGLSEVINRVYQKYEIKSFTNISTPTAKETNESDSVLRTLRKMVGESTQFKTTIQVINSYNPDDIHSQRTESEMMNIVKEFAQYIDDDTWEKITKDIMESNVNLDTEDGDLMNALNESNFEEARDHFKKKEGTATVSVIDKAVLKRCIDFLEEYTKRHKELETVLKSMEEGEDIVTTAPLCLAAHMSVTNKTNEGIVRDVSLCLDLLLKWLSLEDLFFVQADERRSLHLQVSTNDKSKHYKMATLLSRFSIHDYGAYLVIIREGNQEARIDDVLAICLGTDKKLYAVLRSFIRYSTDGQCDAYVTSKHERNKWTLLDDNNVYVDAKEALALSSYAKCYLYEVLKEDTYYALVEGEESPIKKLETLRENARIVASALSVGLYCNGSSQVKEEMIKLLAKFYLSPNCYPQLFFLRQKKIMLNATGKFYLEEALCIKDCSEEEVCESVMRKYLEKNVPLHFFQRLDNIRSVEQTFKQHIINDITTTLGIYEAPIKCDDLYSKLAKWTMERTEKGSNQ